MVPINRKSFARSVRAVVPDLIGVEFLSEGSNFGHESASMSERRMLATGHKTTVW
jgi:hypothetical protein